MRRWLVQTLRELADEVSVQEFTVPMTNGTEVNLTNVIASFNMEAKPRVLFGAHWDTRPIAELDPDEANRNTPIMGANDGASGVAVLLGLASLMSIDGPRVGVDLVFFDGEDGGNGGGFEQFCIGSAVFAASMRDYAPSYAVVVDMIGDRDLSIPVEANSLAACPSVVREVWDAAERVGAFSFSDETGTAMFDDHIPLIRAGVPAALIIDFDYPYWHTLEDTPDKCSPESLREVGEVLVELVY
jgi:Zn-dependent M28 family amino/carboxypeptidase